jgi:hypothetical protein
MPLRRLKSLEKNYTALIRIACYFRSQIVIIKSKRK